MQGDIDLSAVDEETRALAERIGHAHLRQRIYLEVNHVARVFERTRLLQRISDGWLYSTLHHLLKWSGLYRYGLRNARRVETRRNEVRLPDLPASFVGFRILHLSDLHLDLDAGIADAIGSEVDRTDYDLCVITGDLRNRTHGSSRVALDRARSLIGRLRAPAYGVLGNHDFLEFVPALEKAGLRFLLNESVAIERPGGSIYLSGVDDPYFYAAHNLFRARETVPDDAVSILLSHSPSIYRTASACGWDLMLAGHTHGGQICLPGAIAIVKPGSCPRRLLNGAWRSGPLQGYTSVGAGSCAVPARFFCPPEITIHTLSRAASPSETRARSASEGKT